MAIVEGKKAPAFTLKDQDGKKVASKDLLGKTVVLYFYPKDDTPGCTKEACGFRDLHEEIAATGAMVFGVSPDEAGPHTAFRAKYELPFSLLCDPDREMMKTYDAFGEKVLYGKRTDGVIRSTVILGPDGLVKKHWKKVPKAEEHPARVLEVLRALATS